MDPLFPGHRTASVGVTDGSPDAEVIGSHWYLLRVQSSFQLTLITCANSVVVHMFVSLLSQL